MKWLIIIVAFVIVGILIYLRAKGNGQSYSVYSADFSSEDNIPGTKFSSQGTRNVSERLQSYLDQQRNYLYYVGVPFDNPKKWQKVEVKDSHLFLAGEQIELDKVISFIVTYQDNQLLDMVNAFRPFPEGIKDVNPKPSTAQNMVNLSDLEKGASFLKIEIGESRGHKSDPDYYSTEIKNISNVKIRVKEFGGFNKAISVKPKLKFGCCYNADEFINWFGVSVDGWVTPGELVADYDNYGECYWVYFCETDDGQDFIAGIKVPGCYERKQK